MRNNSSKQSEIEGNNVQNLKSDIIIFVNLENKLLEPPKEELLEANSGSIKSFQQSEQTWALQTLYFSQINYGFAPILRQLFDYSGQQNLNFTSKDTTFSLVWFTSSHTAQTYIHIVPILRMLEADFWQ